MLLSDRRRLDRLGPADPFVARQRGDVFPLRQGCLIGRQGLLQIRRQFVNGAIGNALLAHAGILQIFLPKSSGQLQIDGSATEKFGDEQIYSDPQFFFDERGCSNMARYDDRPVREFSS